MDGSAPSAGFAAPHWAAAGVAFDRFSLAEVPASAPSPPLFDIYNFHAPFIPGTGGTPDLILAVNAVDRLENILAPPHGTRLLPPLLMGDFNVDSNGMKQWELQPGQRLERFEIVAYSPPESDGDPATPDGDVIGLIEGKPASFESRFKANALTNRILPELTPYACGTYPVRWSDHCAQYVELGFAPR